MKHQATNHKLVMRLRPLGIHLVAYHDYDSIGVTLLDIHTNDLLYALTVRAFKRMLGQVGSRELPSGHYSSQPVPCLVGHV